jgi:hypothetical protein
MGKLYNVSFDSTLAYGGANNNKRTYVTNWASILPPDKAFKVTFSFSAAFVVIVNAEVMTLQMDLGQAYSFAAGTSQTNSTRFIGYISHSGTGVNGYYNASSTTNPPIYIDKRPSSNITEVAIHEGLSNINFTDPLPGNYVLTLCFEEL